MTDTSAHAVIAALRGSHDRITGLVSSLDESALSAGSYDTEWSVAQVLSHLGSGARIYGLILEAALAGEETPAAEVFQAIWAEWDAKSPTAMRDDFLIADAALVAQFEAITDEQISSFSLSLWGMVLDVAAFGRLRLAEHALHTWDVAVVLDPSAQVAADAVDLLIDGVATTASRSGKPADPPFTVRVVTSDPTRELAVSTGEPVAIAPAEQGASYDGSIELPAEALLRLVSGRLDEAHTPVVTEAGERGVADLRAVFPGY